MTMRLNNSRPHRHGVVLVMTLLALVLLVGLIIYVYNVGQQVNSRMTLQHAADSAAISGSTWMARSMNQVAMDNVGQAKTLASVLVLDSLPLATEMSMDEATAWEARLRAQLDAGLPNGNREGRILTTGLEALRSRMERQRDILRAMHEQLATFSMESITYYAAPDGSGAPYGQLWRATQALDEFSQVTADSSGVLAQSNAVRWGKENRAELQTAFVTPVLPKMPAVRGDFSHFRFPLAGIEEVRSSSGRLMDRGGAGGAIPDMVYPYRLGPWARLHRWRDYIDRTIGGTLVQGNVNVQGSGWGLGGRSVGSSARTRTNDRWVGGQTIREGYRTYGPLSWELRRVWDWAGPHGEGWGQLADTFFASYMSRLSHNKLQYMFFTNETIQIHRPQWTTDFAQATQIAQANPGRVFQTMYYLIEVHSSLKRTDSGWLRPGTFRANVPPPDDVQHRPFAVWMSGWRDPNTLGAAKIHDHVWRRDTGQPEYYTDNDPEIGIIPRDVNRDGVDDMQPVYVTYFIIWGGIDTGGNVDVGNPCNWNDGQDLPAPLLLDTSEGDYNPDTLNPDADFRRKYFTFLGSAQATPPQVMWYKAFGSGSPSGRSVAIAQAKLFNHTSFDLWTQDWETNLMPVTRVNEWLDQMGRGANQATATNGLLTPAAVMDVHDGLNRLDRDMMQQYMKH